MSTEKAQHPLVEKSDTELASDPKHEKIFKLEKVLLELPQVEMKPELKFCDGMYARTILIPKGTALTGAIHRYECFFIIRQGEIIVNDGEETRRLSTGYMGVSPCGAKRAGLALEDTVVTTVHLNLDNETDLDKLWEELVVNPEGEQCQQQ